MPFRTAQAPVVFGLRAFFVRNMSILRPIRGIDLKDSVIFGIAAVFHGDLTDDQQGGTILL
jgi:hypothetical protein